MHVLYINILLLTLTVIMLKEFLFNKLLNTPGKWQLCSDVFCVDCRLHGCKFVPLFLLDDWSLLCSNSCLLNMLRELHLAFKWTCIAIALSLLFTLSYTQEQGQFAAQSLAQGYFDM